MAQGKSIDTGEVVLRLLVCALCGALFALCGRCYRGQRYCGVECRRTARRKSLRLANGRHQASEEGRLDHADRQRAYRARLKAAVVAALEALRDALRSAAEQPAVAATICAPVLETCAPSPEVTDHRRNVESEIPIVSPSRSSPPQEQGGDGEARASPADRLLERGTGRLMCRRCERTGRLVDRARRDIDRSRAGRSDS